MKNMTFKKITSQRLFLPIFCLALVLLVNIVTTPNFFAIEVLQPLNRRRARSNCICQSADSRLPGSAHRRRGDWLLQWFSGCKVKHPADGSDSYHVYRRARYRPADHGWTDHIRARGQLPYPGRFPYGIPGSDPVYRGGRRCGADFITLEENGTGYVHPVGRYQ